MPKACPPAILLAVALTSALMVSSQLPAQPTAPPLAGDYTGVLAGALHLKLHIIAGTNGSFTGTLDSVDQGAMGIPCSEFQLDGTSLSFRIPPVNGTWKGTVGKDGSLTGTWSQGQAMALQFIRSTFVPAEKPSGVDGIYLGTVNVDGTSLRAQIHVQSDSSGREYCTFDSLEQTAVDWECANVRFDGATFSFEVPKAKGAWTGKLGDDKQKLTGVWKQGDVTLPLDLARQTTAAKLSLPLKDAAIPPVGAADLKAVLDKDLKLAHVGVFRQGSLSEGTGAGVVVGVVQGGVRRIYTWGTAHEDSIFEIGSITKTFTGLILARMVEKGEVKWNDPVRIYLPEGTAAKPTGAEITLLDIATQHSGLPRMPDNFHPADPQNPYADYKSGNLYEFLHAQGLAKPAAPPPFLYSNLAVGLLGQALANRANAPYPKLLEQEVTGPLGLHDTVVSLSDGQRARFIQGHNGEHKPAGAWELDALAGAGAIRSTASDMLTYLEAQLHPEKYPTLASALRTTHELRADAGPAMHIGLLWLHMDKEDIFWHNGGTGGFSSYAFFDPKNDCAGMVLFNTTVGNGFSDMLGMHIRQRLLGEAAVRVQ